MALAVSESAQIVGVLLVFALMVGPPATAQRLVTGLWSGMALSAAIALVEAWLGIAIAYQTDWPVSFCISLLSAARIFSHPWELAPAKDVGLKRGSSLYCQGLAGQSCSAGEGSAYE